MQGIKFILFGIALILVASFFNDVKYVIFGLLAAFVGLVWPDHKRYVRLLFRLLPPPHTRDSATFRPERAALRTAPSRLGPSGP
jgi:hypothetical protein